MDYLPFGETRSGGWGTTHKFTGDERDSETGLDHTFFRQYSSSLGRWSSPDPLAGDISDPQSLNRYSYVLNNPLAYADSLGADPNCGDGARPCPLLAEDGEDFGCSLDGISTSCGYINGLVRNGLADPCPGNNCNGVQSFLNANGTSSTYQLQYVKQWLCCQIANTANTIQFTGYSREGYAYVLATVLQFLNSIGANFRITASLMSTTNANVTGGGLTRQQAFAAIVQGMNMAAHAIPTVCGGGGFAYGGAQREAGEAGGFIGGLLEYDSRDGGSADGLVEGEYGRGGGGAFGNQHNGSLIGFLQLTPAGGVVAFNSGVGLYLGGGEGLYGYGVGAYANVTSVAGCH